MLVPDVRKVMITVACATAGLGLVSHAAAVGLRIVNGEDEGIEDARITLWRPVPAGDPFGLVAAPLATAVTNADGRANLPMPRLDGLLLLVDHPKYAPFSQVLSPEAAGAPIRLEVGTKWQSVVRFNPTPDGTGRICASWQEDFARWGRTRTWLRCADLSATGEFTLVGLPSGEVDIEIHAFGHLPLRRRVKPGSEVKLELKPGILLAGTVVGPKRAPLAQAWVRAQQGNLARTGDRGTFELAVASLPVLLTVTAPGFRKQSVTVDKEAATGEVVVQLGPSEQITGTLLGDRGEPLKTARLWVQRSDAEGQRRSRRYEVVTKEGSFAVDLPEPGQYSLRIGGDGYRDLPLPQFHVAAGEAYSLGVIELDRGGVIRGRVVGATANEPLRGADVELLPQGTELYDAVLQRRRDRTLSDEAGEFTLSGLGPGRYEVRVRHQGFAMAMERFNLEADEVRDLGDLWLQRGTRLCGRTVDRQGNPRGGLTVKVVDPENQTLIPVAETTTGDLGEFVGPELSAGRYRLHVLGDRLLLAQEIEIREGEENVLLELVVGGAELEGIITRGGSPVAGGFVTASSALDPGLRRGKILFQGLSPTQRSAFGIPETRLSAEVTDQGRFRLFDAPAGALWLTYVGDNGHRVTRQVWVPERAQATVVVEISGAELRGLVVDEDSESGLQAQVRVLEETGTVIARSSTDASGFFLVSDLETGERYTLEVNAEDFVTASLRGVEIQPDAPLLRVPLRRGADGGLKVRLQRIDGTAVAGVLVTLLSPSGYMVTSLPTNAYGRRDFQNLRPGSYFVVWSDALAGTGISTEVLVRSGSTAVFDKVLGPGGGVSLGCGSELCADLGIDFLAVYSEQGLPIGPYLSGISPASCFSADGRFALGRLAPGSYFLRLWSRHGVWDKRFRVGSAEILVTLP